MISYKASQQQQSTPIKLSDKNFGVNIVLVRLMEQRGFTQARLSKALGVDRAYVNRIIHYRQIPTVERMISIAQLLSVDSRVIWQ